MRIMLPLTLLATLALSTARADPLFPNSVASNDLDFITGDDPGTAFCLRFSGLTRAEMPDKRNDVLFADDVRVFAATFADDTALELWVHPDIATEEEAIALVTPVTEAIARLPIQMRSLLNHVVIHSGDETAFAEDVGRFFVLYSDNIRSRISTHDLQETVFHESVHATIDVPHADSPEWLAAQAADGAFVTTYAAENPEAEDMAETALFAWTTLKHPGRLPPEIEASVSTLVPARLAFFDTLFADWTLADPAAPAPDC
jgi:hypothetical protein